MIDSHPYRLAIVETHPIQYKVPWFRRLAAESGLDVEVLYAMVPDADQQGAGFGVSFEWDLPLLDGYPHRVLENVARRPCVTSFGGCNTPSLHRIVSRPTSAPSTGSNSSRRPSSSARPFDAVIVNGWVTRTCIQALLAARRAGIPCIVRGEANDIRKRTWWKQAIQGMLVRQYAAAIYIGRANYDFYRTRGVVAERLFFGPYCVDNDRFAASAATSQRSSGRRQWGVPDDAFCFLFCGKLQVKKRPADVLSALARMTTMAQTHQPAVHLLVVGDGELRVTCENLARERNLPVSFSGFLNQSELPGAYAASDCLVVSSDSGETWGLVVNEAMACGVPAIVSDQVGCAEDLIVPNETGFVYPCGDVDALGVCMRNAVKKAAGMRVACQKRVAGYSYNVLVKGTVDAVKHVVNGGLRV